MALFQMAVEMKPVPKGRPRHTRSGHTFTPARTREAEKVVSEAAIAAMNGAEPLAVPISLKVEFFFRQAKSNKTIFHTQVPDLDNLTKLVSDAMNGIVFKDDSQIVLLTAVKQWANIDMIKVEVDTWTTQFA